MVQKNRRPRVWCSKYYFLDQIGFAKNCSAHLSYHIFFWIQFEYLQNMCFELVLTFYLRLHNFQTLCSANFGLDWLVTAPLGSTLISLHKFSLSPSLVFRHVEDPDAFLSFYPKGLNLPFFLALKKAKWSETLMYLILTLKYFLQLSLISNFVLSTFLVERYAHNYVQAFSEVKFILYAVRSWNKMFWLCSRSRELLACQKWLSILMEHRAAMCCSWYE